MEEGEEKLTAGLIGLGWPERGERRGELPGGLTHREHAGEAGVDVCARASEGACAKMAGRGSPFIGDDEGGGCIRGSVQPGLRAACTAGEEGRRGRRRDFRWRDVRDGAASTPASGACRARWSEEEETGEGEGVFSDFGCLGLNLDIWRGNLKEFWWKILPRFLRSNRRARDRILEILLSS